MHVSKESLMRIRPRCPFRNNILAVSSENAIELDSKEGNVPSNTHISQQNAHPTISFDALKRRGCAYFISGTFEHVYLHVSSDSCRLVLEVPQICIKHPTTDASLGPQAFREALRTSRTPALSHPFLPCSFSYLPPCLPNLHPSSLGH